MPILVPRNKRVSPESDPDGTSMEKCTFGYELLLRGLYAVLMAPNGQWDVVWFQSPNGAVKQARWQSSGWTITEVLPVGKAMLKTPLAAVMWGPQNVIRLYYLSPDFELCEWCWDQGDNKYDGALNGKKVKVAPYSKLSAIVFNGPSLRVYYQGENNAIEEYMYGGSDGWSKGSTLPGDALPGTSLAYVNRQPYETGSPSIRGYFQTIDGGLAEHVWEAGGSGWNLGNFRLPEAPLLTPIAATVSQENNSPKIHVFWLNADDVIVQCNNYRGWGEISMIDTVSVVTGSYFAATSFTRDDGSVDVRIYGTNALNILAARVYRYGKWEKNIVTVSVGKEVAIDVIGA